MKKLKKFLALVMAVLMVMSLSATQAFATSDGVAPADDSVEELGSDAAIIMASGTKKVQFDRWTRVYTGTGSAVNLYVSNHSMFWLKIEMYDYDGVRVWDQGHTVSPGGTGSYYVGSNVKYVNMMIDDITGAGYITVTTASAS